MQTVLVTGAGGYIGTTLVPMLLERNYAVRAVDRFFFGQDLLVPGDRLTIIRDDVRKLRERHFENVDCVIDLAAVSNDPSGELFQDATWAINHASRERCAQIAKASGVKRYILPSSCSIYGFLPSGVIADEQSAIDPLTTYAKANRLAEEGVLRLADDCFTVAVLRQATVFGLSPRMRFDLAINGMAFGAYRTGKLPLMRDGSQWRPMVHVRDTAEAQIFMLGAPKEEINGQIFNVGSAQNMYQLKALAEEISVAVPRNVVIEWYGERDHRSYRVSFDKIESLGWRARFTAADGVREIVAGLRHGGLDKTPETITLEWYKFLEHKYAELKETGEIVSDTLTPQQRFVRETEMYGGMLNI